MMIDQLLEPTTQNNMQQSVLAKKTSSRNWGTVSHKPIIHGNKDLAKRSVHFFKEIMLTWLGISVTLLATAFFLKDMGTLMKGDFEKQAFGTFFVQISFVVVFLFLIYGNLLYQICRLFYFKRLRLHRPTNKAKIENIWQNKNAPWVTMLIPSYKEEPGVIRQSLLSCALQEYPRRQIALLIDNPPDSTDTSDRILLEKTRQLPEKIQVFLDRQAQIYRAAYAEFQERRYFYSFSVTEEVERLVDVQLQAAQWFADRALEEPVDNHVDALFVELTYRIRADREFSRAKNLTREILNLPELSRVNRIDQEYYRLAQMFEANISSLERKQYINLSHASNKAMNLNSYLSLMGKHVKEIWNQGQRALIPCQPHEATLRILSSEFVLTLDADSLLDSEYTIQLVSIMMEPGNERLGVIQTPYTAVPNAPGILERMAGATTDMQYIIHQGFTKAKATFWVGANALIRYAALADIMTEDEERGFRVSRYIQDQTVIEDTESSIDMVRNGWSLFNYPERLSYSATPPDFGSLLIQRRRWANGGLIILPKMLAYIAKRRFHPKVLAEAFFRIHYLISIAAVNIGLVFILAYPLERPMHIFWLPFTAIPYYFFYGRDLILAGYRMGDLFRIYALNLLLIPVNLGGVAKSIWQFITKKKISFSRTPKIDTKTLAPPKYVFFELMLCFYCFFGAAIDSIHGRWFNAVFALINGIILGYAFYAFFDFKANVGQIVQSFYKTIKAMRETILPPTKLLELEE